MTYRHVLRRSHVVGIAIGLVVAFGLTLALALSVPTVRLLVFHSSPDDTHLTEGNVDAHSSAITETVDRVVYEPLGCGSGCSGPASFYSPSPKISENYYLQIAEQYGIIGLVLWLAIVLTTFLRILRFKTSPYAVSLIAFLASASVIGLLLHVWADPAVSIAWWAMAGAFIGYNEGRLWTKSKDSSRSKT